MSPTASEEETFKILLQLMSSNELPLQPGTAHLIIPWDEEGNSKDNAAWYDQCKVHMSALMMMMGWAEAGEPLTAEKLLACHSMLMQGAVTSTGENFQSRFREFNEPVAAGNYVFPNKVDHEKSISIALEKMEADFTLKHPVEWSCKLMLTVLTNHPFLNGNGRMAQLCFAYGLARSGIPCSVIVSDLHSKARSHYIRAVLEAQGQKGPIKFHKIHSMAIVFFFATLKNMLNFCGAEHF